MYDVTGSHFFVSVRIERHVVEVGARIAQEVPRAVEERVGDVGLAPRLAAALRTRHAIPRLDARQRRDAGVVRLEVLDVRQLDRQVLLRHRDRAALVAVDDRDRRTPVALPRDAPVVQPVVHDPARVTVRLEPRDDPRLPSATGKSVELPRVHEMHVVRLGERRRRAARGSCDPFAATTRTMGRSNAVANSKSRSSWPGTAMIAPVPYSIST